MSDWHVPVSLNQSDLDHIFDVQRANADGPFEHELVSTGDLAKGRRNAFQGGFTLPDGERLPYRMIVPGDAQILQADIGATQDNPPARSIERRGNKYSAIGKEWKHHDLHKIVTGQCVFSRDMSLPDMLYGEVVHPPAFGAKLVAVDAGKVKTIPGVTKIIVDQ